MNNTCVIARQARRIGMLEEKLAQTQNRYDEAAANIETLKEECSKYKKLFCEADDKYSKLACGKTETELFIGDVNNVPLTLEEIEERDAEPVYWVRKDSSDEGYGIVGYGEENLYLSTNGESNIPQSQFFLFDIYDHKPMEAHNA